MLTRVRDITGKEQGYLIGDYFLSSYLVPYFFKSLPKCKTITGFTNGTSFSVDGKIYTSILRCPNPEGLNLIYSVGGKLQDIIFWRENIKNLDTDGLSEIWRVVQGFKKHSFNYYVCYDKNKKEIGYLLSGEDLFSCSTFYINMLEVVNKGNGDGTRIVKRLLNLGKGVEGLSLINSVEFWSKCGATIEDNLSFIIGGYNIEKK